MSLRNAVLAELGRNPARAFLVYKRLDAAIGEFWHVNDGHVFQILQSGEKKGWVVSHEDEEGRPVYELTGDGRTIVEDWLRSPDADVRPQRDEMYLRLRYCEGNPPEGMLQAVQDQLHNTIRAVRRLRHLLLDLGDPAENPSIEFEVLALEGALNHFEVDLNWLREVEGVLEARLP